MGLFIRVGKLFQRTDRNFSRLDIKPENFIMTPADQLRIIDLGLSFHISPSEVSVLRPFAGE